MKNFILLKKFHKWYDTIKEPARFILLLAIAWPVVMAGIVLKFGTVLQIQVWCVMVAITCWFAITRIHYIESGKRKRNG